MIHIQRIRIKDVNMTISDRNCLKKLRQILVKHFKTKDILFEYEEEV